MTVYGLNHTFDTDDLSLKPWKAHMFVRCSCGWFTTVRWPVEDTLPEVLPYKVVCEEAAIAAHTEHVNAFLMDTASNILRERSEAGGL